MRPTLNPARVLGAGVTLLLLLVAGPRHAWAQG